MVHWILLLVVHRCIALTLILLPQYKILVLPLLLHPVSSNTVPSTIQYGTRELYARYCYVTLYLLLLHRVSTPSGIGFLVQQICCYSCIMHYDIPDSGTEYHPEWVLL
jgi:hypothetical protein